jgi:hypothetical protein
LQKRSDRGFVRLKYIQAVFDVITRRAELGNDEKVASLAALQYRIRFPDSSEAVSGALVPLLNDFIPQHVRKKKRDEAW